jgi:opacity protein-like surface antigen
MKSVVLPSAALIAAVFSLPSLAQNPANPPSPMTTPARAPWYGGISVGESKLDNACVGGFSCDAKDTAYRLFAGTKFNNWLGLEVGGTQFGKWDRAGGQTKAWAADVVATAGVELARNSSIFAKLGAAYTQTEVSGTAPGLQTGKETDWAPRYGVGGQIGLSQNWALRADWDRYQNVTFRGGEQDVDVWMLGVQYSFR